MGKDKCSLYLYTEEEKATVRKELGLTEASINDGVDAILEWFNKQPHLVEAGLTRYHAEKMIIISKGSIERAKEKIDNYYKYRSLMPEIIQSRETILHSPKRIWENYGIIPLPKLYENKRIFIANFKDTSNFSNQEYYRRVFMQADLRMKYDYMAGDIWIIDLKNFALMQLLNQNPMIYKKCAQLFLKGLNWRLQAMHIINASGSATLIQRTLDFFSMFLSAKMLSRIIIHESIEGVYKHVPQDLLPEDYGGKEPHTDVISDNVEKELKRPEIIEYLLEYSKLVSKEELRPRDENSEEYLTGSFKKLEFD